MNTTPITTDAGYLSKRGASVLTSNCQRTLDYARADGSLPFYRVGRKILFKREDLEKWMSRFRVDVTEVKL